jgi:hypothetical protein
MPLDRPAIIRADTRESGDDAPEAHLRFIRDTMGRAATFTAVPGLGGVAMGIVGLIAAFLASRQDAVQPWLGIWLAAAVIAGAAGAWATWRKARDGAVPLLTGAGRKFVLGLAPALAAGAALTLAVVALDAPPDGPGLDSSVARASAASFRILPGLWLLLYGAGVAAAGALSVRPVPLLGALCMAVGVGALLAPASWGDLFMGAGFGVLQIAFGVHIARRYGG